MIFTSLTDTQDKLNKLGYAKELLVFYLNMYVLLIYRLKDNTIFFTNALTIKQYTETVVGVTSSEWFFFFCKKL